MRSILTGEAFGPESFAVIDEAQQKHEAKQAAERSAAKRPRPKGKPQSTFIEGLGPCTYQDYVYERVTTANADPNGASGGQISEDPTAKSDPELGGKGKPRGTSK